MALRRSARRCPRLHQLDAVAERVIDEDPVVPRQRLVVAERVPGRGEALRQRPQPADDQRRVGFAGGAEFAVDAEMQLDPITFEPAAAA